MLRHLCIIDRRLEFLATLSDTVDTEEAAVDSMEVGRPSGELQDRPEQQEQLIRCVVEGVMAKGDKGISVSWREMDGNTISFVTLKGVPFFFFGGGGGGVRFFPWQTVVYLNLLWRSMMCGTYSIYRKHLKGKILPNKTHHPYLIVS